jgi:hypothetical protein
MNFSKVTVDLGNGKVVFSEQLSKEEDMIMHEMGGHDMTMGPRMMKKGPDKMMMGGYPG